VTQTAGPRPSRAEAWETYLERTPVEDMEREKLLLLLNRNEWNIARVARLMGVTRRTIYLRLQRHNIPRERVPKNRPRKLAVS
jgi:transcriptional regulator of acetoin/glycerol metabolism